jgi:hypothetical protein
MVVVVGGGGLLGSMYFVVRG